MFYLRNFDYDFPFEELNDLKFLKELKHEYEDYEDYFWEMMDYDKSYCAYETSKKELVSYAFIFLYNNDYAKYFFGKYRADTVNTDIKAKAEPIPMNNLDIAAVYGP